MRGAVALPIEDVSAAAQVCKGWAKLFSGSSARSPGTAGSLGAHPRCSSSSSGSGSSGGGGGGGGGGADLDQQSQRMSAPATALTGQYAADATGRRSGGGCSSVRWHAAADGAQARARRTRSHLSIRTRDGNGGAWRVPDNGGADHAIALTDLGWAPPSGAEARLPTRFAGRGAAGGREEVHALGSGAVAAASSALRPAGDRSGSSASSGLDGLGAFDEDATDVILRRAAKSIGGEEESGLHDPWVERRPRTMRAHREQVLCLHAHGEMLASCASDGEVLIWSLRDAAVQRRHQTFGRIYSIGMGERTVACGAEGSTPVRLYDWRDGQLLWEASDEEEAPKGVTTCLHRDGVLAADNNDSHSQLRIWDLRANPNEDGSLRDCFSLPPYVKGVRCVCAPTPSTLICGTTNGWLVHVDLRSGRYEKKSSHADCINGLAMVHGPHVLASGGDDKIVRLFDAPQAPSPRWARTGYAASSTLWCLRRGAVRRRRRRNLRAFDYSAEAQRPKWPMVSPACQGASHRSRGGARRRRCGSSHGSGAAARRQWRGCSQAGFG